ncbi:hypothetical protein UAS_01993 [Enterococcus asini ATCC 700915]|uniref:Uncharacterized protein n=1 Tax=Enterococcus asini ATCC 700915 TaxID=1158606 RepID=R2PKS6_9ENTE|nr:hypothetical protein UAS_01993 [Enterococcus asini ATCC 700915]EOT57542.1 hypothetical protein I579_01093 [Enterococcus asini ATCC 700915]OJG12618.1 hypothetical protein RU94_GL002166 [Enterococcus asini]
MLPQVAQVVTGWAAAEQAVAELAKVVSALEQAKRPEQVELPENRRQIDQTQIIQKDYRLKAPTVIVSF